MTKRIEIPIPPQYFGDVPEVVLIKALRERVGCDSCGRPMPLGEGEVIYNAADAEAAGREFGSFLYHEVFWNFLEGLRGFLKEVER